MAIHNPVTISGSDSSGNSKAIGVDSSGNMSSIEQGLVAGERNPDSLAGYLAAVPESSYFAWATADNDTQVTASPALFFGLSVTTATAAGAIEIRDSADDTGTVVLTIPAGSSAGTVYNFPGIKMNNGIFIDDASSSGAFTLFWRAQ